MEDGDEKICNKKLMLLMLVATFSCVALMGCEEKNTEEARVGPGEGLLTEKKVVNKLEEKLDLKQAYNLESPIDKDIAINPSTYTLGNGDGNLFIYVFESIEDRYEMFPADLSFFSIQENEGYEYILYNAKNAAIVFKPEGAEPFKIFSKISDVAYNQLNDINKKEFKGEGEYWKIKLSASYFNYKLESNKQTGYGTFTYNLDYKGEETEKVNSIMLWYVDYPGKRTKRGVGKRKLNSDSTLELSLSENIDGFPIGLKKEEIEVFVEWNGNDYKEKEELIIIKREKRESP
ncbi:MAG: hypothetical protein K9L17_12970 [Clostridiales bacterium]|nr:hypothetical protein [Clostridiales bacterium]